MFGLGMSELVVIFFIVLIVFGGKKIPEVGEALGKGIRNFKGALKAGAEDGTDDNNKKIEKHNL